MTEATDTATKPNLWDNLDKQDKMLSGDFPPIPNGTYQFVTTGIQKIKRDKNNELRVKLEFTINGADDKNTNKEDMTGRKYWDGGALEGSQIHYFLTRFARTLAAYNPDVQVALADMPNVDIDEFTATVQPEGAEAEWIEYFQFIIDSQLNFVAKLKYLGEDNAGYDNYRMTFVMPDGK